MATMDKNLELAVKRKAENLARYVAVKHLDHEAAAREIGVKMTTVRAFRNRNPEVRYHGEVKQETKRQPRDMPGTIVHAVPRFDPNLASNARPVMPVRLPAPPWGGGFDRNGVSA